MLSRTNLSACLCLVLVALALGCHQARADEARIWSDKSGKHEIRAKFVDVIDGEARLERPNGDITRIPLTKLSKADQKYIREYKKGHLSQPGRPDEPRVLAVGDQVEVKHFSKWHLGKVVEIDYHGESAEVRLEGESDFEWDIDLDEMRWPGTTERPILVDPVAEAIGELKTIRPDMSDVVRQISDDSGGAFIESDPGLEPAARQKPRSVRLQGKTDFHESPEDFSIASESRPLAVILHSPPGVGDHGPGRIEIVDLRRKKIVTNGPSLPNAKRLQFSPSGEFLVTITVGSSHKDSSGQLDFWSVDDRLVKHVVRFTPYVMDAWPNAECEWVEWLDDERIFTANREGRLILWQYANAKALYEIMIDRGSTPVLSPGKRQLAVPTSSGVQIYETRTGELLASVGSGNLRYAALAFSPSGTQLAAVSQGFVDVIDVTTGETTRSFPCKHTNGRHRIAWIDEEYLFTANGLLIHVPLRITAWRFDVSGSLTKLINGTPWLLLDDHQNGRQFLSSLEVPPREAVRAVQDLDEEDILAIRPGVTVSINADIRDPLLAEDVKLALTEACQQAGIQVGEDESLSLRATIKNGGAEEIRYQSFHDPFGQGETFEVTKRIYVLQLQQNGLTIWKRESVHGPPHHLRMQKNETIRSAVARVMKPTAASFRGRLPTYVVRPEFQEPLGNSTISSGR